MFLVPDMQLPQQQASLDTYLCPWSPQRAEAVKPAREFASWEVVSTARMSVNRDLCSFRCNKRVDGTESKPRKTPFCKKRLPQTSTQLGWSWSEGPM